MLLAAQSMAVGTVMVPWVCKFADPVMATGYHMLLGGLPLLALSLYRESDVLLERLPQLTGACSLPPVLSRYRGPGISCALLLAPDIPSKGAH